MCSQVWRKAGIGKDCEDHAVEKMSMQWETADWAHKDTGLQQMKSRQEEDFRDVKI